MSFDVHDLDQRLFGWVHRVMRRITKPTEASDPVAIALAPLELRLSWLASAVAERPLRIEATDDLGGAGAQALRLPRVLAAADDAEGNARLYVVRTVLDATAARHGLARPTGLDDPTARLAAISLVPLCARLASDELPGFSDLIGSLGPRLRVFHSPSPGPGVRPSLVAWARAVVEPRASLDAELRAIAEATPEAALEMAIARAERAVGMHGAGALGGLDGFCLAGRLLPRDTPVGVATTEAGGTPRASSSRAAARRPDTVRRIELPEHRDDENPLVHSFEKVHTADTYQGGRKALDGEDELADHAEALDELDLREVVRTREVAKSIYSLDGMGGFDAADVAADERGAGRRVQYDEWDGQRFLRDHCTVYESVPDAGRPPSRLDALAARDRRRVRNVFESLAQGRRARGRMPSGGEVDVDAVVERYAAVRAGHEGSTRLYVDRPRTEPEVATTLLLDLSASSDAYLHGTRVLDVTRSAVRALASVLDELGAPCSIAGFRSHTRNDCRYLVLKGFDERFSDARGRLESAEPDGYTRIGPAIRHATQALAAVPARRRLLLLLTDGRPTDVDRYEGRHGLHDVKKAIDEAAAASVRCFALTVAERRSPHLATMFGEGGYGVMRDRTELVEALVRAQAFVRR